MTDKAEESKQYWQNVIAKANKENPSFFDNMMNALLNQTMASGQFWSFVSDKLGLPRALRPSQTLTTKDINELVDKTRPTEGWGGFVGDVVGTTPYLGLGPISGGLAAGVASGIGQPVRGVGQPGIDYEAEKATQIGIGAGVGLASGLFGKLLGQAGKRSTALFEKEAVQIASPPGEAIKETGQKGFTILSDAWDKAYEALKHSGLRAKVDDKLVADLARIESNMMDEGATDAGINSFQKIVMGQIINPALKEPELSAEAVQNIQSRLGRTARLNKDISAYIRDARDAFLGSAERYSDEAASKQLSGLRSKYQGFLAVERAVAAASGTEGHFTPGQLSTAVRSVDTSSNKAATAAGASPLSQLINEAVANKVGQHTTPGRLVQGFPILGPAATMLEQSPTLRAVGTGVEAGVAPAVGAIAPSQERGATIQPVPYEAPEYVSPLDNMPNTDDQILRMFEGPGAGGSPSDDAILQHFEKESDIDRITGAVQQQESGGRHFSSPGKVLVSPSGAYGNMQIMPSTFKQYARSGESILNEKDNYNVGRRIIASHYDRYGGDPRKVAAAYFSGQPNYRALTSDVTGKQTSSYVSDVIRRLQSA